MEMTRKDRRRARREAQALELRRRALSPVRIAFKLASVPVVAACVTVSVYVRTSDYPPGDAMRHLVAMSGCRGAAAVALAPAMRGHIGYHLRNDPDGDGIACGPARRGEAAVAANPPGQEMPVSDAPRMVGGAKFLRH
ncbi:excalibur calcium-binding domain-containing protein [Pseudoruegeria sp. HB172150]|uniref:excalibur calcium-binding domain-containing protein n=1 Tax=Pseudoruegeria sp. HB172150 TaxID=2721164 RepID=UPI001C12D1C9|nr:excalibur calcium-binding domain-containing protein [Pseudoruegeria sp. HB172150]